MIIEMSLTEPSIESNYGHYFYDYGHHSFCISIKWNGTIYLFFVIFVCFHALISYRNKLVFCISKILEILFFSLSLCK